jgi:fatty-acyl-CoA synthase
MAEFTFTELTPTSFLDRAAYAFTDRPAVVDGDLRLTYAELGRRSHRLAGALAGLGVEPGERVATLCTNSHVQLEAHNGVPLAGAVLVPMNIRLSVDELTYVAEHSGAKVLLTTRELAETATRVADAVPGLRLVAPEEYEPLMAAAAPATVPCTDERGLLAINYTSGTTGRPKGVMYHHRGAYLQAVAMAFHARLGPESRYLWTLPMFHCDGWCFPWAVTAAGAVHICLRALDADEVWRLIRTEGVTHFSAAPTVLTMIAGAEAVDAGPLPESPVQVATGGAPPSPTLLSRMATLRMNVSHLYGLTETYGPIGVNDWQPQWNELPETRQAELKARQGVGNVIAERIRVVTEDGADVPPDGQTMGELVCRGNDVMLGYYRDEQATAEVTLDGWYRTGDLGVTHPDGYVEIRDRGKDVIISGGENIASIEVEQVLDSHPGVLESAVVARPDERWGEIPVAYVTARGGEQLDEQELIEYVREHLARFKAPRQIVFDELPKTSTGKIQKNVLREKVRS